MTAHKHTKESLTEAFLKARTHYLSAIKQELHQKCSSSAAYELLANLFLNAWEQMIGLGRIQEHEPHAMMTTLDRWIREGLELTPTQAVMTGTRMYDTEGQPSSPPASAAKKGA